MKLSLESLMKTSKGKVIFSVLLGFGIATLFRKACKERNCIVFKFPPLSNIANKIYMQNNNCIKYKSENVKCNKDKVILNIEE